MIISKGRLKDFLEDKGIVEARAIEIAKRISELNPKNEHFLNSVVSVNFWEEDKTVTVTTSGNARGYCKEGINFPMSYLSEANWEEQYNALLQQQKSNEQKRIEHEAKVKEEFEIKQLKELKAKYPNL